MKRILAFTAFTILAAGLFSGCSSTLHPAITAQVQSQPSGATLVLGGTGFSPTNPCASLSIFFNPGTAAETVTSINKQTACNASNGSFTNYQWSIPAQTCPSGNTTNTIPATVLGIDIQTFNPAAAQVSIPCSQPVAAALCPSPLLGSQLPTANWNASSAAPGYYAYQSAILNSGNASPILTQPTLNAIKSAMGGAAAFNGATFNVPSGTNGSGTGGGLPTGVISCSYDSPAFTYGKQKADAQVTIACTTSCSSL
jgi:hypothetical protein